MSSTKNPGRVAGLYYLLLIAMGPLFLIYIPDKLYVNPWRASSDGSRLAFAADTLASRKHADVGCGKKAGTSACNKCRFSLSCPLTNLESTSSISPFGA